MTAAFRFVADVDDNHSWLVTVPALPEVTTFAEFNSTVGEDAFVEVRRRGLAAVEEALAARIARGDDIPGPDGEARDDFSITLPLLTTLKISLYMRAKTRNVNRAELCRRLGWNRESVDRLFRLDHLSRLGQLEEAFSALGYTLQIRSIPIDPVEAATEARARNREAHRVA